MEHQNDTTGARATEERPDGAVRPGGGRGIDPVKPRAGGRGADLLVRSLSSAGIDTIFALSGNQIMPIFDACIDAGITIVHTRHEAAAVFMAEAWSQLTGRIGVALVTAGAGALNALGALSCARASQTPVLLLTGDSPLSADGRGAFQAFDQIAVTTPLTKLSRRPASPQALAADVAEAVRTALSPCPGPVHLALPADLVAGDACEVAVAPAGRFTPETPPCAPADRAQIGRAIASAERPLVLVGPRFSATREGLLTAALERRQFVPVIAMESPRGLGDPALGAVRRAVGEADLIVCLGKPVDFTVGFGSAAAADCAWIVAEADAEEERRARTNLGGRLVRFVGADPRSIIAQLGDGDGGDGSGFSGDGAEAHDRGRKQALREAWCRRVADLVAQRVGAPVAPQSAQGIHPAIAVAAVQRQVDRRPGSIVVCDGGEFGQWAQAGISAGSRIVNGPSGAIGGGPAYALAACKARPGAAVFALMGDGTAGFHLAEFETAVRVGAPFVAVIGNDRRWNAEHQIQLRDYGADRLIGCALGEARYDRAVEALGGYGVLVTRPEDLDAALDAAVASGRVACVTIMIEGVAAPAIA